jgi:hypothetical protein
MGGVPSYFYNFVNVTFRIFPSAYHAPLGRLPLPSLAERELPYKHDVLVTGWDDAGESLYFRNSWGTYWGDKGYGRISRQYFERFVTDAWLSRRARWGLSIDKLRRLYAAPSPKAFAAVWTDENPRYRYPTQFRGARRQVHVYDTWSYESDCLAEVIQIRHKTGVPMAWAHLFHLRGSPRTTSVREFYVWPWFRRRGYGSWLETLTCR